MKKIITVFIAFLLSYCSWSQKKSSAREYYNLTVYHFKEARQELELDKYLSMALLPALHRQNIKHVGVFKPLANDTAKDKIIYVHYPITSPVQVVAIGEQLLKDGIYQKESIAYTMATHDKAPYYRMETILLYAFRLAPQMKRPNLNGLRTENIYELRSYESPTEKYYRNKVEMFNEGGEITLFDRLGFNAVFYADVISGSRMPNLMYITCFDNMAAREAHWKAFVESPEWKKLISDPYYEKNVNKADIVLMKAASYSDY